MKKIDNPSSNLRGNMRLKMVNDIDWDYAHTHVSCSDFSNMIWAGTFAANAGKILSNHYPEVDIAWQRAADSFYNGEVFDERNRE